MEIAWLSSDTCYGLVRTALIRITLQVMSVWKYLQASWMVLQRVVTKE